MSDEELADSVPHSLAARNVTLRVSRPVSACQRCRSAKTKCDGKLPVCTTCEKAGRSQQCSSGNDQHTKGKERSYVASLETRIDRLEREIERARTRAGLTTKAPTSPSTSRPSATSDKPRLSQTSQKQEATDVDNLVSDFGFLSVNATSRDFHGFTTDVSFARLVLTVASLDRMPVSSIARLPPRNEIIPLVQHYVNNIHVLCPFIPEARIFSSVSAVCEDNSSYAEPFDHWVTLMVVAVSLASLSIQRGDKRYQEAVRFASAALEWIEFVVHPGSARGVQAILLLVLYAMWDPQHFNSWCLIGVASRLMVDLGLHQAKTRELTPDGDVKRSHSESQLWIFQSVYVLDRSISMVHQRGFSFTDDSVNLEISGVSALASPSSSPILSGLRPAPEILKLRKLQSACYQKLYCSERLTIDQTWSIICQFIKEIDAWLRDLQNEVLPEIRDYFTLEVSYTKVLILGKQSPSNVLQDLNTQLVAKHASAYIDLMSSAITHRGKMSRYTSHDLLRASFVAQHYVLAVEHLQERYHTNVLKSSGQSEKERDAPFDAANLLAPFDNSDSNVDEMPPPQQVTATLDQFDKTLEYFGFRFDYPDILQEYRTNSSSLRLSLQHDPRR